MITVNGLDELRMAFEHMADNMGKSVADAVVAGSQKVRTTAIKSIQRHQSQGVTYEKTDPKRTHTASLPGFAPNSDTGTLVNSIQVEPKPLATAMLIGTNLKYGKNLEFGTRAIRPRPWLVPALESNRAQIENMIKKAVRKAAQNA